MSLGSLAALSSANGGEDSEETEEAVTGADDEGKKYRTNHSLARSLLSDSFSKCVLGNDYIDYGGKGTCSSR